MRARVATFVFGLLFATACGQKGAEQTPAVGARASAASLLPELPNVRVGGEAPTFSWDALPGAATYALIVGRARESRFIWTGAATHVDYRERTSVTDYEDPARPPVRESLGPGGDYRYAVFAFGAEGEVLAASPTLSIPANVGHRVAPAPAAPVAIVVAAPPAPGQEPFPPVPPGEAASALASARAPWAPPAAADPPGVPAGAAGMMAGMDVGAGATNLPDWHRLLPAVPDRLGTFIASGAAEGMTGRAMGMNIVSATRRYADGPRSLTVQLSGGDPARMAGMIFAIRSPDVASATEVHRFLELGGQHAVLSWTAGDKKSQTQFLIAARYFVNIEVSPTDHAEDSLAIARALPLDAIAAVH